MASRTFSQAELLPSSLRLWPPNPLARKALLWILLIILIIAFATSSKVDREAAEQVAIREKVDANLVRLAGGKENLPGGDNRGWIMSPLHLAAEHGLGGALSCVDVHVGTILPGHLRANHRHHAKNESFLVWGAKAAWRLENSKLPRGYAEVVFERSDVAVFTAPRERAHALRNMDGRNTLNLMVCADTTWDPRSPDTDYRVWSDF